MTPADLKRYFEKSGDAELLDGELVENEHGFMVFDIQGTTFRLLHVYGDGRYWQALAERAAKLAGCERVVFGTRRPPAAFVRRHGYKLTGYILEKEI